jgi:hypothetical protein
MDWRLKAGALFILSHLPRGAFLYRSLQRVSGSNRLDIHEQYARKSAFLQRAVQTGISVTDRSFFEIGTGWYPVFPVLLSLLGARRVVTADLNPWLTPTSLRETLTGFASIATRVATDFNLRPSDCREQLDGLIAMSNRLSVTAVLSEARIDYRMPLDATDTGFPAGEFDYVISTNVFEHVPKPLIQGILRESHRILRADGRHLHHVDVGDHFSLGSEITTVNFLKYSPSQWRFLGGVGLAYHNRLRCVDYLRLFEEGGFRVLRDIVRLDERALTALRVGSVRVHPDFARYSQEELAAAGIDLLACKAGAVARL